MLLPWLVIIPFFGGLYCLAEKCFKLDLVKFISLIITLLNLSLSVFVLLEKKNIFEMHYW